jgi:hypothetical protein
MEVLEQPPDLRERGETRTLIECVGAGRPRGVPQHQHERDEHARPQPRDGPAYLPYLAHLPHPTDVTNPLQLLPVESILPVFTNLPYLPHLPYPSHLPRRRCSLHLSEVVIKRRVHRVPFRRALVREGDAEHGSLVVEAAGDHQCQR